MALVDNQIVQCYMDLQMTPEEIAEEFEEEVDVIKLVLKNHCPSFRKQLQQNKDTLSEGSEVDVKDIDFSLDDLQVAHDVTMSIIKNPDASPSTRADLTKFVINSKKGRLDAEKLTALGNAKMGIHEINAALARLNGLNQDGKIRIVPRTKLPPTQGKKVEATVIDEFEASMP